MTCEWHPVMELAQLLIQGKSGNPTIKLHEIPDSENYIKLAKMLLDPLFCPEFVVGIMEVVRAGAEKYDPNGWLEPDGVGTSKREQYASLSRHLAKAYVGQPIDEESGLYHYQHIATRAMMAYTRISRNITNPKDGK